MDREAAAGKRDTDTPGSGDQPAEDTNVPVVQKPGEEPWHGGQSKDDIGKTKGES
ncbi:MAG: hypothetical protein ACRDJU_13390 [Actinomycetota bacterium]